MTDLVVLIQPTHAWRHLVHNSNLGGELVLHQVGCQVPTHKPNTCSEQTDYQTDRPADKRQSGGQTARQTDGHITAPYAIYCGATHASGLNERGLYAISLQKYNITGVHCTPFSNNREKSELT